MIISVVVWCIYPSWVNDKLRAWEGLGHSGMFLGEALKGQFSFEARNYVFSFQSYVHFEEFFFVSRTFERFGAKRSSSCAFGIDNFLEVFLKTLLRHRAFFANFDYDHECFWKFPLFCKAEPVLLVWKLWRSPGWAKHFGDGTSKTRMKTWLPGVDEIKCRRTMDRRRDWYCTVSRHAMQLSLLGLCWKSTFDRDFTPDQEKEITFKGWPPGYPSWKLGWALDWLRLSH